MSFKRLRAAAAGSREGHGLPQFYLYQRYDAAGKPVGYTQALYARFKGEWLGMGTSSWYLANTVPENLEPITEFEAKRVLQDMISARVTHPKTMLYPVEPWDRPARGV